MIVADTSGLLALFNSTEPLHEGVRDTVGASDAPIVVSPYVVSELDYLVGNRIGVDAELAVLSELAGGAYDLASFGEADVQQARDVIERYRDQEIGIADASVVVLAHRHRTRTILTLDRRHFSVVRPLDGGRFRIIP